MKRLMLAMLGALAASAAGSALAGGTNGIYNSPVLNYAVQQTTDGTSLNLVSGASDDSGPISGDWDLNFWASSGNLRFWGISTYSARFVLDGSLGAALQPGDTVGASSTFSSGSSVTPVNAWFEGADAYAGFKFNCDGRLTNPVPSGVCYGYVHITTTAGTGFPATIVEYSFDGDGNDITIAGGGGTTWTVTPSVDTPSGTISPDTPQVVNDGETTAFTLTPDSGFHIDTVGGTCGGSLVGSVYTTDAVTADCTVVANFAADGGGGTFPPDENFDEVMVPDLPADWTSAAVENGEDWVTQDAVADSAPNAAFTPSHSVTGEAVLTSPLVMANTYNTISFQHEFNTESTWDGGVLEISIDGGAFTDIIDAGGSFLAGGYNGTLGNFSGCAGDENPLADRAAWTGSQTSFQTVTAALPAGAVGHDVQFRWRLGSDCSVNPTGSGWWIDSVTLAVAQDPAATITPMSLSFEVAEDATASDMLNIANAAGSNPLTFSITSRGTSSVLRPVVSAHVLGGKQKMTASQMAVREEQLLVGKPVPGMYPASIGASGRQGSRSAAPWAPRAPDGSVVFQWDDGSYENSIGFGSSSAGTESGAVWVNRFNATGPLTIDSVSILWPTQSSGTLVGLEANIVVYYDADGDGDVTNAVRLGTDNLITIASEDTFETYATNFSVPGAGDVYIGFVDAWALAGGYTPRFFPAAIDQDASQGMSYVSGASTPPTDVDNLSNNDSTGVIDDLTGGSLTGNWLIRATGTGGGSGGPCTGPIVTWLTATPNSGSVAGGADTNVTVTVNPTAGSLTPGDYTAEVCVTTNDPTQALVSIPVSVTVTAAAPTFCDAGSDEIFCDGFDGSGGGGGDVVTGTIDQDVLNDGDGSTFDFVTQTWGVYDAGRIDDINLYNFGDGMYSYWYGDVVSEAVGGVVDGSGEFAVLHSGDTVGPSSTISASSIPMTNWIGGADGYIGLAFYNEDTGMLNYGYIHMTTSSPDGYPAHAYEFGYNSAGDAITIP